MTEARLKKMKTVLSRRQPDLTVVMENIHDPHNVSAILRSADAVGLVGIHLIYTYEEFPSFGKKSSASATKWIEKKRFASVQECYHALRKQGFLICATHLAKDSASLYDLDLTKKIALVFGNEHRGVSDEAAELSDVNFQIPMTGMIQSLNVSVACAVTLFEAFRQRSLKKFYLKQRLPSKERRRLLEEWTLRKR